MANTYHEDDSFSFLADLTDDLDHAELTALLNALALSPHYRQVRAFVRQWRERRGLSNED